MTDLSRAYQEVRSLPDEALQQELAQPSGMLPGYLVLSELTDRDAIRGGSNQAPKTSMAQELLNKLPRRNYASGGMVTNPMATYLSALGNPELMQQLQQQMMLDKTGNITPLGQPADPGNAPSLISGGMLNPQSSQQPEEPRRFNMGGLASLYPR